MNRVISIVILCIGILLNVDAQTFTQRIQGHAAGQGTVTIHQDEAIDRLVNEAKLSSHAASPAAKPTTPATATAKTGEKKAQEKEADNEQTDEQKPTGRGTYKVIGYRVQAFAGGNSRKDRQQAEHIGNSIRSQFIGVPVYVHFHSPRWICRVGNYRTYEEAHQMLLSLRNMGYNQATIVKGKITVSY